MKKNSQMPGKTNWPVTILLILGCITIFFPLYMAVIIAFKKPSEMTNDIAGALSLPSSWSFSNFTEAMKVTDFWNSLGNSLLITIVTVVLAILIHSIAGYAIGRNMANSKFYKFSYLYIVSGMFVPFAILMMPACKTDFSDGNRKQSWCDRALCGILYANESSSVFRLSQKYSDGTGRSCKSRRCKYMEDLLEYCFPDHEANACDSGSFNCTWNME